MSIKLIINPAAGRGKASKLSEKVIHEFEKRGVDFQYEYSTKPRHAVDISSEASTKYQKVIALGGDGTVNEVGEGLIGSDAIFGVIPLGSGNDFAKEIGIPSNISDAVDIILSDDFHTIDVIKVKELLKLREDAQDERIKCEQRLYQRSRIQAFTGEHEGSIKDTHLALQANDAIYQNRSEEEKRCEKELKKAVRELDVWKEIFEGIKGCGEMLAAKIIAPIGDIRRFSNASKFKKFCGVHVMEDGTFPRNRSGACSGYGEYPRLAIWWLVKEQFPKNGNKYWKDMVDRYRISFREKHPVEDNGQIKYSDAHILKMANWRTANRFAVWLYEEWTKIETG